MQTSLFTILSNYMHVLEYEKSVNGPCFVQGPVNETLDEMRQRLKEKQLEQEEVEKRLETVVKSRRSETSVRSDDGGEHKYPEKIILLAEGKKIPWLNISRNHGGFKTAILHHAASNLQSENLGTLAL